MQTQTIATSVPIMWCLSVCSVPAPCENAHGLRSCWDGDSSSSFPTGSWRQSEEILLIVVIYEEGKGMGFNLAIAKLLWPLFTSHDCSVLSEQLVTLVNSQTDSVMQGLQGSKKHITCL